MSTERIIERVRKMLALAQDSGASEGERDNALRMAHATLAKYNLSMAALEQKGQRGEDRGALKVVYYSRPWAKAISRSMAKLFSCEYIIGETVGRRGGYHIFVGLDSNAATASEMASWLIRVILKESRRSEDNSGDRRSFAWGAAYRIDDRVNDLLKKSNDVDSQALTVWSGEEEKRNKDWISSNMSTRRIVTRSKAIDHSAASRGREYGDKVSLNRQLNGKSYNNAQLENK